MKKFLLSMIFLFLVSSNIHALEVIALSGVAGGGSCSQTPVSASEDWEAIADGEEWSNDANWIEYGATTDIFVGDNALYHGGSLSGIVLQHTNGYGCGLEFTEITTGYATIDLWFAAHAASVTVYDVIIVSDGSPGTAGNQRIEFQVDASNNLQYMDNVTWTTVAALSADTFVHVEVEINVDTSTGINCVRIWINGTEHGSSPFDTKGQTDPAGIDTVAAFTDNSTDAYYWWDDLLIYGDERCVP